ncbi:hypothetical protein ACJX0J_000316 [Zea mays]
MKNSDCSFLFSIWNGKCASFILISIFSSLLIFLRAKYLLVHLKGTPENRSKSLLIGLDESFKLTRTIWFSEKTPGTLHQNKIVYEETTRKIHILIHKSYIGIEIIVNFENLQMHKYIPEREISVFLNTLRIFPFHFSVYQMMIHSAIWSEQGFMFSLYQYTKLILLRHAIFSIHYL